MTEVYQCLYCGEVLEGDIDWSRHLKSTGHGASRAECTKPLAIAWPQAVRTEQHGG